MSNSINYEQVGYLLGLAATRDQRTIGEADVLSWHADLNKAGITYADADAALTEFYAVHQPSIPREHRFRVVAADVISIVRKTRAERLKNFTYEPPPTLNDPAYIQRYRGQIGAVASGMAPAPADAPMLEGGPHRSVADGGQGIGRKVPAADAGDDGDLLAAVRRKGPLGFECPECHAMVGFRCRNGGLGKPRKVSHSPRLALAAGKPLPTPEEQAAAQRLLEQRLAYSRAKAEAEPCTFVPPGPDGKP